jgi:arsenate reductase (thioredoxin)
MKLKLVTIAVLISFLAGAQNKKILFVCEHGSAKSVIAATYFNKLAKERNLAWEAFTRGTDPEKQLSQNTEQGLRSDGLLNNEIIPQKVSQNDVSTAQHIVLFYPLPKAITVNVRKEFWDGLPPVSDDYPKARDAILRKVSALLDSLAKQ